MKLTSESKLFLGIGIFSLCVILVATIVFSQPAKPIAKDLLITPTTHTQGNIEAKTWLVEFSDFECPACHIFSTVIDELIAKYPDRLLVAYRHYPLPMHPESYQAARAAEAAGLQGKFFEMGTLLFDNQASLSATLYSSLAKELKLDVPAFEKAFNEQVKDAQIEDDILLGNQLGIRETPTFYLNGIKLELRSIDDLKIKVEEAIQ